MEAKSESKKSVERDPILEVQNLIKSGKIDEALKIAEDEFRKTKNDKIYNLYGIALFKKGDFKKASEVFGELHSKYPDNLNILLNYVKSLIAEGKIEEAERILREAAMLFIEDEKAQEKILFLLNEVELIKSGTKEIKDVVPEVEQKKITQYAEKEKEVESKGKTEEIESEKREFEGISEEETEEERKGEEIESLIEKIEEVKEEIEEKEKEWEEMRGIEQELKERREEEEIIEEIPLPEEEGKEILKEEKVIRKFIPDEERITFEELGKEKTGTLKRGRMLEITLQKESEIVIRETFVIFISGSYKVFPLYERENGKLKKSFFGGENHKFIKVRGDDTHIIAQAEYISITEISEDEGEFVILEPFLMGFDSSLSYQNWKEKITKKKVNLVELSGNGKVILFSGGRKLMWSDIKGKCRISVQNFVGVVGESEIQFEGDSVEVRGIGKALIRI